MVLFHGWEFNLQDIILEWQIEKKTIGNSNDVRWSIWFAFFNLIYFTFADTIAPMNIGSGSIFSGLRNNLQELEYI